MKRVLLTLIVLVLGALGYLRFDGETEPVGAPGAETERASGLVVAGPEGATDLAPTLERIRRGEAHPHRNDGSVFQNRERLLPSRPRGYYREFVHPTRGRSGPGAQRIVIGREGEVYYTPDHYESFIRIDATLRLEG